MRVVDFHYIPAMNRILARFLALASASTLLLLPVRGSASPDSGWAQLADQAIARFQAIDNGAQSPFSYAYMASAVARRQGWSSPLAQQYLAKVWSMRLTNTDGSLRGWGTSATGTTVYTITLADHIGPVLLEAWQSGQTTVTASDVVDVGELLVAAPRNWTAAGYCVSYLQYTASSDCVHNQNSAIVLLLEQMRAAGLFVYGADYLVMQALRREIAAFLPASYNWPYSDTNSSLNDADHNSLLAEAHTYLDSAIGRNVVVKIMGTSYSGASEVNSPLGHMRAGALGSQGCLKVDRWLAEAQAYYSANLSTPLRLAQVARWSARVSAVC